MSGQGRALPETGSESRRMVQGGAVGIGPITLEQMAEPFLGSRLFRIPPVTGEQVGRPAKSGRLWRQSEWYRGSAGFHL